MAENSKIDESPLLIRLDERTKNIEAMVLELKSNIKEMGNVQNNHDKRISDLEQWQSLVGKIIWFILTIIISGCIGLVWAIMTHQVAINFKP